MILYIIYDMLYNVYIYRCRILTYTVYTQYYDMTCITRFSVSPFDVYNLFVRLRRTRHYDHRDYNILILLCIVLKTHIIIIII